jgi:hypothetical protein
MVAPEVSSSLIASLIPIGILAAGFSTVSVVIKQQTNEISPQALRAIGLVLVIMALLFLTSMITLVNLSGEQSAAAFGLLGTVTGYVFGHDPKSN